ncbi:GNAT family N-acetyltransferase [Natronosalvus halobius]|uniref:GNAT family N-acetyltransferase n=1 Tax=Natronosalvus halobius TaxID=2953746 RepID=UPI00209D4F01|nr:GNAT family N-acetyltransferase [Natronosalvus halobius]USZ70762.1 GNAT family N-acetyltransferase [Natronosalvus halobius]
MSRLDIRRATGADAPAIARLYRQAYASAAQLGYPSRMTEIDAETVAEWLEREAVTLVASANGAAVDTGPAAAPTSSTASTDEDEFVGTVRLLEERDEPYLERLAVHPDWQGEGVATTLVDRVEELARDRGYDCIQLTTFDEHPFLLEWYRERGYEPTEHHESSRHDYAFVSMEKPLE